MKKQILKSFSKACLKSSVGTMKCASSYRAAQPKRPAALEKLMAEKK